MGYFSEVLAEPAAQAAGRLTAEDLISQGVIGKETYASMFGKLGVNDWQVVSEGNDEAGNPLVGNLPGDAARKALQGYTFDWQNTGVGNTGTLTMYDAEGKQYEQFQQQDKSTLSEMGEWGLLAAAGFGGLGLAGMGPLGNTLGGVFGTADAGAGASLGSVGGEGGVGLAGAGEAGTVGSGLTLGGSSTYGTIAGNSAALGAGGAGLGSGVGLTAPAFTGSGLGMTAGVGAGAAAGAGGLSGMLSTIGSYLPAASQLASIASGVYGMKLAGDARQASDPFAPYRGAYAQQLAALEKNPGSIVTRPGFQAGIETIGRKSAGSGYYGSGNMAAALSRYSGDFYNQEATRLAGLAGANQTPGAGQIASADLASQSLGSIGYGLGPLLQRLAGG